MTVSLETAKKLKEAGFPQYGIISLWRQGVPRMDKPSGYYELCHTGLMRGEDIAAPTTDELLAALPAQIIKEGQAYGLEILKNYRPSPLGDKYSVSYVYTYSDSYAALDNKFLMGDLPEALAECWLWLKKEGLL